MPPADVSELFAQAYVEAARAEANMREATPALEDIRDAIRGGSSVHAVLGAIQTQIGQVDLRLLAPVLCTFRASYTAAIVDAEVARLNAAFDRDPNEGWRLWLTAFAELFQEDGWRPTLALSFADRCLKSSPQSDWPIKRVRRNIQLVATGRWPEAYDWFEFLSNQKIATTLRARMLAILAEIQLYRFQQPGRAQQFLDRAKELAPGDILTSRVQAEVYLGTDRIADAEAEYRKICERRPNLADGYLGLAECADAKAEPVATEAYYKQAVQYAPGQVNAHSNLMSWYARNLGEQEELVRSMFSRVLALSIAPAEEYLNLGLQYRKAKNLTTGRELLNKALQIAPTHTLTEVWLGYFDMDEAAEHPEEAGRWFASARSHFERDMDACPEGCDGPWGLASIAIEEKNWPEADKWCEQALATHQEWEHVIRVRQARIAMERMDFAEAERHIMRSLDLEPVDAGARTALSELAGKVAEKGDTDGARRLLRHWRQVSGESAEYLYQNELGLIEFRAQNWVAAIDFFEAAILARPEDPVLYSNAASAAENLRTSENRPHWLKFAIDHLTKADSLIADKEVYRSRLTKLLIEQRFINTYGENALTSVPVVTLLRVDVPKELLPAILNPELTDLSEDCRAVISRWHQAYRARRGVTLPGVQFGIREDTAPANQFRMLIREKDERLGETSAASLLADVLDQLERFVDTRIGNLIGHEEVAALLRALPGNAKDGILASPALLTTLVAEVRGRLEQGLPVHDLPELAQAVLARGDQPNPISSPPLPADADSYSTPPSVSLYSRTAPTAFSGWAIVAAAVFLGRGVIVPAITFGADEGIPDGELELRVNGRRAGVELNGRMSETDISYAVMTFFMREAGSLVVKPLVDWYLLKMSEVAPALYASVSSALSTTDVIAGLRARVQRGESIRDLPLALEHLLRDTQTVRDASTPAVSSAE